MGKSFGPKIVMVGGGSYNWCPGLLRDLMTTDELEGSEIVLLDPNLKAAGEVKAAADAMARRWGKSCRIRATASEPAAFRDADFVIITISTGGLGMMAHDLAIPQRHGIFQTVGDTVGPGGWRRSLRNVPVFVHQAGQIELQLPAHDPPGRPRRRPEGGPGGPDGRPALRPPDPCPRPQGGRRADGRHEEVAATVQVGPVRKGSSLGGTACLSSRVAARTQVAGNLCHPHNEVVGSFQTEPGVLSSLNLWVPPACLRQAGRRLRCVQPCGPRGRHGCKRRSRGTPKFNLDGILGPRRRRRGEGDERQRRL